MHHSVISGRTSRPSLPSSAPQGTSPYPFVRRTRRILPPQAPAALLGGHLVPPPQATSKYLLSPSKGAPCRPHRSTPPQATDLFAGPNTIDSLMRPGASKLRRNRPAGNRSLRPACLAPLPSRAHPYHTRSHVTQPSRGTPSPAQQGEGGRRTRTRWGGVSRRERTSVRWGGVSRRSDPTAEVQPTTVQVQPTTAQSECLEADAD